MRTKEILLFAILVDASTRTDARAVGRTAAGDARGLLLLEMPSPPTSSAPNEPDSELRVLPELRYLANATGVLGAEPSASEMLFRRRRDGRTAGEPGEP